MQKTRNLRHEMKIEAELLLRQGIETKTRSILRHSFRLYERACDFIIVSRETSFFCAVISVLRAVFAKIGANIIFNL